MSKLESKDPMTPNEADLVSRHYDLAMRTAKRHKSFFHSPEVIIDGAINGLIEAIQTFDPDENTELETYIQSIVKGRILDSLREHDPVSRHIRQAIRAVENLTGSETMTDEEIEQRTGISRQQLDKALSAAKERKAKSLDSDTDMEYRSLHDIVTHRDSPDKEEELLSKIHLNAGQTKLADAMRILNENQRLAIQYYYIQEMNLEEIAPLLGVSASRISQILKAAFIKLQKYINPNRAAEIKKEQALADQNTIEAWVKETYADQPDKEITKLRARIKASQEAPSKHVPPPSVDSSPPVLHQRPAAPKRRRPKIAPSRNPILQKISKETGKSDVDLIKIGRDSNPKEIASHLNIPIGQARVLIMLARRSS